MNLESGVGKMSQSADVIRIFDRWIFGRKANVPEYWKRRVGNTVSGTWWHSHSGIQITVVQIPWHLHRLPLQNGVLSRAALFRCARL